MAQRVSWTNSSDGHEGTYVYHSESTMDPANLPAPLADIAPVALSAQGEYIDNRELSGDHYFRVQDYDGAALGTVSDEFVFSVTVDIRGLDPTYNTAPVYSNDDRTADSTVSGYQIMRGASGTEHGSGKRYYEALIDRIGTAAVVGITAGDEATAPGLDTGFSGVGYFNNGRVYNQGAYTTHATYGVGDVIAFAVDYDAGNVDIYKNNALVTSETIPTSTLHYVAPSILKAGLTVSLVTGDLTYTPPSGYTPVGESA
jgi:hypothetical protein